ncbi:endonuclease/exonuclease/phosphatase family protein [Acetobacter oeni]|uniref:endonuclease/exonuclease/phosphatase family protein n=1 Tax=Acetobacter oeni TaxID=304077 RepID=UPI0021A63895|nr:endonuclease/exonuclease/phosphatase family protein [Acetobacter oeni]
MLLVLPVVWQPGAGFATSLKLATWNLGWLTSRAAGDPALPDGIYRRNDADIARLAAYADHLDADIIGFQEVDGAPIAARVFRPPGYRIIMSGDHVAQQVGVAIRGSLNVTQNPVLTALNVYPPDAPHALRSGLDITVSDGRASLRLLVVHLKTGCWENTWTERQHACPTLRSQFAVLDDWALERNDSGEAFAILGDFNRRMTAGDPYFLSLTRDTPMRLTTAGRASPCWGGEYFIDHILLGGQARDWLTADSLRVMTYRDPGVTPAQLSDHCAVSVRLAFP